MANRRRRPGPAHMRVWRSVRAGGETKTRSSRRTLALPHRAIVALREQHDRQTAARQRAGAGWAAHDVVFASANGAALDSAKVRRGLRNITAAGGLDPDARTPRELRHSVVSLLSDEGVPIEQIARLIGHVGGSKVTEAVYRIQLRPVIDEGATAMNRVFPVDIVAQLVAHPGPRRQDGPALSFPEAPDQAVCGGRYKD